LFCSTANSWTKHSLIGGESAVIGSKPAHIDGESALPDGESALTDGEPALIDGESALIDYESAFTGGESAPIGGDSALLGKRSKSRHHLTCPVWRDRMRSLGLNSLYLYFWYIFDETFSYKDIPQRFIKLH